MKHLRLLITAIVLSSASFVSASEPLTDTDREELTVLYDTLHADMKVGVQSNYPNYFDPVSLQDLLKVHQSFIAGCLRYITEEQLSGMMKFKGGVESALKESDPTKYFGSIEAAPGMTAMASMANVVNKVVGVTGDSSKAFVVVEGFMDGELGKTDPFYSVWPAVKTEKGWRLDVSSNMVRELRIKVKNIDQQLNPGRR